MESEVLQELYERYYSGALLYCMALCGSRETAEDLVADAFVKAYLSLDDGHPSFQYWLLRVCKNLWIDRLRRQTRYGEQDIPHHLTTEETTEDAFFKTERSRALWRAIAAQQAVDREIVVLHYYADVPLGEIARRMGKSPAAIRQRLVRLRQKIKEEMEEQGYGV